MDKDQAVDFVKQQANVLSSLTNSNCHFSNVNRAKPVWWLSIPKYKFNIDLYLLLRHREEELITILKIPRNTFSSLIDDFYLREENDYIDLEICSDTGDKLYMRDIKDGGSEYNFRKHIQIEFHLS